MAWEALQELLARDKYSLASPATDTSQLADHIKTKQDIIKTDPLATFATAMCKLLRQSRRS
jgi:hypothetical protein